MEVRMYDTFRMRNDFPCDDDMETPPVTADDMVIHQVGWLFKTFWSGGVSHRTSIMLFDGTDYDP